MGTCEDRETLGLVPGPEKGQGGRDGDRGLVFDDSVLDDLADILDVAELDSYLALLEPTVRPRVEALVAQLEAGDESGLLVTAHALSGGAACYGLIALSAAARQIEAATRGAQPDVVCRGVADASALVEASLAAVWLWRGRVRTGDDEASFSEVVVAP